MDEAQSHWAESIKQGETFAPVGSDQRFHDGACRSRSHRERIQGEIGHALHISPVKRSGGAS